MFSEQEFFKMVKDHIEKQKKEIIEKHIANANAELSEMISREAQNVALDIIKHLDYEFDSNGISIHIKHNINKK